MHKGFLFIKEFVSWSEKSDKVCYAFGIDIKKNLPHNYAVLTCLLTSRINASVLSPSNLCYKQRKTKLF